MKETKTAVKELEDNYNEKQLFDFQVEEEFVDPILNIIGFVTFTNPAKQAAAQQRLTELATAFSNKTQKAEFKFLTALSTFLKEAAE